MHTILNKTYFPNLNGLRFLAASMVVFHHIEQFKADFGLPSLWGSRAITHLGKQGVTLFFVLSGFLITFLLLQEKKVFKKIKISDFYVRRILRIWPLYFLLTFLGFFIFPSLFGLDSRGYFPGPFLLYLFILPNVSKAIYGVTMFVDQAWSVGVEEQFYLIWPHLIQGPYSVIKKLSAFFLITYSLKIIIDASSFIPGEIKDIYSNLPLQCMAVGGMFAYLGFCGKASFITKKGTQFFCYLSVIFLIGLGVKLHYYFRDEVFSVLFGVIIFNLALNPKSILSLEKTWIHELGKITFGIYMYHRVIIYFLLRLLLKHDLYHYGLLAGGTFSLCIAVSYLSYKFYELPFIRMKEKFTKITSG